MKRKVYFDGREIEIEESEGEWAYDEKWGEFVCSECGGFSLHYSPYCPNCGKPMKEWEGIQE